MLDTREKVEHWFGQLAVEVCERLVKDREANNRIAKGMTVSINMEGKGHASRAGTLPSYDSQRLTEAALRLVGRLNEAVVDSGEWRPKLRWDEDLLRTFHNFETFIIQIFQEFNDICWKIRGRKLWRWKY